MGDRRGAANVGPAFMVGVASVELATVAGGASRDPHEAARQDALDEATQKLHCGERHRAPAVVVGVILPLKRDALPVEGEQPVITERHPIGIAPEIAQQGVDEGMPLGGVARA